MSRTKKTPSAPISKLEQTPGLATMGEFMGSVDLKQKQAVFDLCRLTGLNLADVLRLLVSTGLYVVVLDLPGSDAFEFLLKASVGKERFAYALKEGADINGLELVNIVAEREAEERLVSMPYLSRPDAPAAAAV